MNLSAQILRPCSPLAQLIVIFWTSKSPRFTPAFETNSLWQSKACDKRSNSSPGLAFNLLNNPFIPNHLDCNCLVKLVTDNTKGKKIRVQILEWVLRSPRNIKHVKL